MKSFETFYFLKEGEWRYLEEVQEEYENNNGDISKYKGHMMCPECRNAELSFTRKTSKKRAFLSKKPTSKHEDYCSYINEYASNREVQNFFGSLSEEQIADRLESVLNYLTRLKNRKEGLSNKKKTAQEENPFVEDIRQKNGTVKRKTIPRKRINAWIDKSEEGNPYIFYGDVKLAIEEKKNSKTGDPFNVLIIKCETKGEWKRKKSIIIGSRNENIDEDSIYSIALYGIVKFRNGYPQIQNASYQYRKE